jgi:hypothetical protein
MGQQKYEACARTCFDESKEILHTQLLALSAGQSNENCVTWSYSKDYVGSQDGSGKLEMLMNMNCVAIRHTVIVHGWAW